MSAQDKKWQAEDDARTLMYAITIKKDSARYKRAVQAAKRIADEKKAEAEGMYQIATNKVGDMVVSKRK